MTKSQTEGKGIKQYKLNPRTLGFYNVETKEVFSDLLFRCYGFDMRFNQELSVKPKDET